MEQESLQVFDPDGSDDNDISIHEYDIVSSPNDFNVSSYFNFIESQAIHIPDFQRHYVWDIRRASKLVESILLGLPIPQIFLYEQGKNDFIVIDGQQRLMSIYFFIKGRFPKRDARGKIRSIMIGKGKLEPKDWDDDTLFVKFKLSFQTDPENKSPYDKQTYESLGDMRSTFDLRTIRNIMVKQVRPDDDHSSVFELFHRLNTGGLNLSQQEIRMSLFYGPFVRLAALLNEEHSWRQVLGGDPDPRQKDVEMILRMLAMAEGYRDYRKPLSKFINAYCARRKEDADADGVYQAVFLEFATSLSKVPRGLLLEPKSKRVSVPLMEALFVAACEDALAGRDPGRIREVKESLVASILGHSGYDEFFTGKTTDTGAVQGRVQIAQEVFG